MTCIISCRRNACLVQCSSFMCLHRAQNLEISSSGKVFELISNCFDTLPWDNASIKVWGHKSHNLTYSKVIMLWTLPEPDRFCEFPDHPIVWSYRNPGKQCKSIARKPWCPTHLLLWQLALQVLKIPSKLKKFQRILHDFATFAPKIPRVRVKSINSRCTGCHGYLQVGCLGQSSSNEWDYSK